MKKETLEELIIKWEQSRLLDGLAKMNDDNQILKLIESNHSMTINGNPTLEEFTDNMLDAIYMIGKKDEYLYTLTLSQATKVCENIYKQYVERDIKCVHPYRNLERNANGLFCTKCKSQVSNDPNIY